ncbi:putative secreted protein (Por secretion system target) [Mariniflexile fucanivorans]|uniref:Putative secreted protein (Por secretion system target) n=1 Tax=Mariniflexile fucanivorans TaxID=264023 RepID=A0A4R1RJT0_9FLAO|nr:DNRLRE domain-containing protein [Mariniflexile fucanivorans]TCL66249.1 putative secreted protein (Por secretion system target) [Mariniflexile fucanivorans]
MNKKTTQKELANPNLNKKIISIIGFLFFIITSVHAQFVHPGITHKKSDLDRMKYMVEAQIDPWYTSYQNMVADSKSSYDYVVLGDASFTELGRDSGVNEGAWNSDIRAAYYNAVRWYITGDSRHAEKAIEIFKAWSNLTSVTSGGTDSLSGGIGYIMIEAAEIIKSTYPNWAPADLQAFQDMLVYPGYSDTTPVTGANKTFYWMSYQGDPGRHGNQGLSGWRTVMAMGIFLDNEKMYDRALKYVQGDLASHLNDIAYPAGPRTTKDLVYENDYEITYSTNNFTTIQNYGYNEVMTNYIWENGQCQESSRDQQHTAFGIGLLTSMAEMAWNQGVDLYSHESDRLLLGLEYNLRYNVSAIQSYPDQMTPWVPTVGSGEFIQRLDRTARWYSKAIDPDGIGDYAGVRTVFEMPVAHYIGRGLKTEAEVKWTQRARDKYIELSGYEKAGWTNDAIGWGGLSARRPAFCYGDPISGFDSNSLPVYDMHVITNVIEAENFDYDPINQGEGRVYHDLSGSNTGGAYRTMDNVDVEATAGGGYNLTSIESGEWLTYTVSVPETAVYGITIKYAASQTGGTIKFSAGGVDITTDLAVPFGAPNSTGDSDWKEYVISSDVILNKGVQSLKITFGGISGSFKLDNFSLAQTGIVKQDQSIKFFTIPVKLISSTDFDPEATASSGLPVSYSSSNTAVATIVSGKIHIVGEGSATITATQAGDAYNNAANNVSQELRVVSAVAGTINLNVGADTYVRDAGNANTNYGSDENIVTVATGRYGYLKFDLSSVPGPIISAKLRIYQRTTFKFYRSIYDVADDNWTESEITWNNKPAFENERARITTSSAWNEWDISSYTAQEYNNDKIITLVVKDPIDPLASEKGIDFRTKEYDSGSVAPVLVIEYSSVPLSVTSEEAVKIKMYPNPVQNDLYMSLEAANLSLKDTKITIYTLNGQKVMQTNPIETKVKMDVSKLSSGVYILKINDSSKSITRKIVKL